jgi:hypothetical protein
MADRVRIIRHEIVPFCGSRSASWARRRDISTGTVFRAPAAAGSALAEAQALPRAERDKGG